MKYTKTDKAPSAIGPYSQAVIVNGFVFCSGQVGVNPKTITLADTVEEQTLQVLQNLHAVLKASGSDKNLVVKTTIFVKNLDDFINVNKIYEEFFGEHKPARATVEVSRIPRGKFSKDPLIEIDAIAVVKSK